MTQPLTRAATAALALSLGLAMSGCAGNPSNTSLYSVNQPVVQRANYTLDVMANSGGLTVPERARLADWFETMDIGYGDRIAIDDPQGSPAIREDVAAVVSRYGLLLSETAPITEGYVDPGIVRVVVTRSTAHVPDCPNWSDGYSSSLGNNTSDNFGCAVNSNIAAMVADPEHLLQGAEGTGETVVMSSNKAIASYRDSAPSGAEGLPEVSTQEN